MPARSQPPLSPFLYSIFRVLFRWALQIKCRFRVVGVEQLPKTGGLIIASNHASFLDPPIIGAAVRQRYIRFMARDTLFEKKFLAWFYYRFGVMPLSREKGDVGAIKTAIKLLKEQNCIVLFPEGTRTPDGELQKAKGGVGFLIHKASVPVVPAYIEGSFEAWPKGAKKMANHPVTIYFGPPICPDELLINDSRGKPDFEAIGAYVMDHIARLRPSRPRSSAL